jgi:glycine/D-amino acid oxidase-like deaminating enzyme
MYQSVEYLKSRGSEIRALSPKEARVRFPRFGIRDDEICLYEPWNGYLESGRAVSLLADLAREEGVEIHENTPVTRVEELDTAVEVHMTEGERMCELAVVVAGVWMGRLLPDIGVNLEVTHQRMVFIEVEDKNLVAHGSMPVWSISPDDELCYGFPLLWEGYVKVSNDQVGEPVDPDMHRSLRPLHHRLGDGVPSRAGSRGREWEGSGRPLMPIRELSRRPLHHRLGAGYSKDSCGWEVGAARASSSAPRSGRSSPTRSRRRQPAT